MMKADQTGQAKFTQILADFQLSPTASRIPDFPSRPKDYMLLGGQRFASQFIKNSTIVL
jgi:hypothetical protein